MAESEKIDDRSVGEQKVRMTILWKIRAHVDFKLRPFFTTISFRLRPFFKQYFALKSVMIRLFQKGISCDIGDYRSYSEIQERTIGAMIDLSWQISHLINKVGGISCSLEKLCNNWGWWISNRWEKYFPRFFFKLFYFIPDTSLGKKPNCFENSD